jgi:hypothetical protein
MKIASIILGATLAFAAGGAAFAAQPNVGFDPANPMSAAPQTAGDLSEVPVPDRGDVITWRLVTNGPVPDTPANRARYEPLSQAGRLTPPAGD